MLDKVWKRLRGENAEHPTGHERRAHTRHQVNLETTCQQVAKGSAEERVRVCDISRGGMRFLIDQQLEPGALVRVSLPSDSQTGFEVLACVIHCNKQTDGRFSIGCAFSDELNEEDLRPFGGRKELTTADDKRVWARFPSQGLVEYQVLSEAGTPTRKATVANISPSGIGLYVEDRVEPGLILDLLIKSSAGGQEVDILACVVFLGRRSEGGWVAGCHFVRELTENDLNRLI